MRASFRQVAARRRAARNYTTSIASRLFYSASSSADGGSDGSSSEAREGELKKALDGALGSLAALSKIYYEREARWKDEMRRLGNDREHVEMLLKQAIGVAGYDGAVTGAGAGSASGVSLDGDGSSVGDRGGSGGSDAVGRAL
jgi:hypothetical protein